MTRLPVLPVREAEPVPGAALTAGEQPTRVRVSLESSPVLVTLTGEIDVAVEQQLRGLLDGLRGLRLDRLVVDVREVSFIDSAGAQPLLDAQETAAEWDGRVELRGPCRPLEVLLTALRSLVDPAGRAPSARATGICARRGSAGGGTPREG